MRYKTPLIFAAIVTAASLVPVAPASASASATREQVGSFPYTINLDCNPYGFHFSAEADGVETLFIETLTDGEGHATRVVVHDSFQETDSNSVTGKTLRFSGNTTSTYDLGTGTRTVTGRVYLMTDPGEGVVIHDSGRVVFSDPSVISFVAGPHQALYGDLDEMVCTVLAAP